MKKIMSFLFLFGLVLTAQSQTVDEVFAKFEAAVGGRDALLAIKTVQYKSTITLNMMGSPFDIPVTNIKENNKMLRREVAGIMGMGKSFSILTDTAGYLFTPAMRGFGGGGPGGPGGGIPEGGRDASLTKMNDATVKEEQYELDAAGAFGHLVNYAAKGHKAELQGTAKANKTECYKVKFTFNNGQEMLYYIDTKTFLPIQTEALGKVALEQVGMGGMMEQMGSDRAKKLKVITTYSNYEEVNGIKFPMKQKLEMGAVEIDVVNSDYQINQPIDAKYYKLQ